MKIDWIDKDNLPSDPEGWGEYAKKDTTRALRMAGEFYVLTSEGPRSCADGYLALDSLGNPYPIALEVFNGTYECVWPPRARAVETEGEVPF